MHAIVFFTNIGFYHAARLRAVCNEFNGHGWKLTAVQLTEDTLDHPWGRIDGEIGFPLITLIPEINQNKSKGTIPDIPPGVLENCLVSLKPDVVFLPGWFEIFCISALWWCLINKVPTIVMSESAFADEPRNFVKELIKKRVVSKFTTFLVGGKPHVEYLEKLGANKERIFVGYDVVDNNFFSKGAELSRLNALDLHVKYDLPEKYFLAACRFIPKKNLFRLFEAFKIYRQIKDKDIPNWKLIVIGDGVLRPQLEAQIVKLNIQNDVVLPGFKRYQALAIYYGLAGAFIHASTSEQWGLVVNEAMASGLPVLVSKNCGCAEDLVKEGINGHTFNPFDINEIANLLLKISQNDSNRELMGKASQKIISEWSPEYFAKNFMKAATKALNVPHPKFIFFDKVLLHSFIKR